MSERKGGHGQCGMKALHPPASRRSPPRRDASSCRTQRGLSALSFCKYGIPACTQARLRQRLITSKFNCAASLLSPRAIRSQTKRENKWRGKEKRTTDPNSKEDPNIAARNHYGHIIRRLRVSALYKDERTSALAVSDAALERMKKKSTLVSPRRLWPF